MNERVLNRIYDFLPFIVLTIVMLVLHFNCSVLGDDVTILMQVKQKGYWEVLKWACTSWSASYLLQPIAILFLGILPRVAWVFFDTAMVLLIACVFSYLIKEIMDFRNTRLLNWLIVLFIFCYPIRDMATAGWISTTMVYIFTFAFTALSLVPIVKIYKGQKITGLEYVVYFIVANIGANGIQSSLFVVGIYALFILERIFGKKKIEIFFIVQFLVASVWLALHLFAPGLKSRKLGEMYWWIDYDMFDALQKLKLALATTTNNLVYSQNAVFVLLCIGITLLIWIKYKDGFYRILPIIPLLFSLENTLATLGFYKMFAWIKREYIVWSYEYASTHPNAVISFSAGREAYLPLLMQFFAFLLIPVCIYLIFGNTKKTILSVAILTIGFISRLAMAMSPTLFASNTRTFFTMYAGMIFVGICVWCEFYKMRSEENFNK